MASGSGDGSSNNAGDIPRGLINRMGNPIGKGSRLPSVRGNRDLTLGGIQRKVFTPNLAAVKKSTSKDETSKQISTPSTSTKTDSGHGRGRGKAERGRGRGRGRGQGDDRTIQLQSEFAFGPMGGSTGASRSGGGGWSGGGGGGGGGSSSVRRGGMDDTDSSPVKQAMKQVRGAEEDKKLLESLLRDDFISDVSSGDPHMTPVRLPLSNNCISNQSLKKEPKAEMSIKREPMDVDSEAVPKTEVSDERYQNSSKPSSELKTVKDIITESMQSEKGELLFLQFPDTVPGISLSSLSDDRLKPTSNTSKEQELSNRLSLCQLKDCNEGYMGKLRMRKSGKAELVLGDNVMDILCGVPTNFHQELVSVRTDSIPGQMIVLGQVNHKLVVTPDYNALLRNSDDT